LGKKNRHKQHKNQKTASVSQKKSAFSQVLDVDLESSKLTEKLSNEGKSDRQIRRAVIGLKKANAKQDGGAHDEKRKFQQAKAALFKRAYQANFFSGDRKFTDLSFLGVELDEAETATIDYIIPLLAEFYLEEGIFPYSRKELYSIYRYFSKYDAIAASAIDTWIMIPLSKMKVSYPFSDETGKKEMCLKSKAYFSKMLRNINLMKVLEQILREYLIIGDVFVYIQFDDAKEVVDKIFTLPPEYVEVRKQTFIESPSYRLRVNVDEKSIPQAWGSRYKDGYLELSTKPEDGSYIKQISRNRSDYERYGESLFARNLRVLFTRVRLYKIRGIDITRNLNPIEIITAKDASDDQLADLEEQVEIATVDPQYKIVGNYEISWQRIGVGEGLYNLAPEWEQTTRELFIGLLLNQEILTAGAVHGGGAGRIRLEVVNRRFMFIRDMFTTLFEEEIFRPAAEAMKFFYEEDGEKTYVFPKLGFKRLPLRDDQELFTNVFNLYQKGSIPIEVILELLGLDAEDLESLKKSFFTAKDPNFNELIRAVYQEIAASVIKDSNIVAKLRKEMGLKEEKKAAPEGEEDGAGGGGGAAPGEEPLPGEAMVPEGEGGAPVEEEAGGEEGPVEEVG